MLGRFLESKTVVSTLSRPLLTTILPKKEKLIELCAILVCTLDKKEYLSQF